MKTREYTLRRSQDPQPGLFMPQPVAAQAASMQVAVSAQESPDVQRLRIMSLGAPNGTRYCFQHDTFEFEVTMYLVGRRWMFLCAAAAREQGGKRYTGKLDKPVAD